MRTKGQACCCRGMTTALIRAAATPPSAPDELNDVAAPRRRAWRRGDRTGRGRCSSSPAPAPARPTCSPIASPISSSSGADPKRIMLATFSRRAAAELNRRVQRLLPAGWRRRRPAPRRPSYAGTFHSIGARLLREYALAARARSAIHDPRSRGFRRPDESRRGTRRGLSDRPAERFPTKATCLCDLFARRQSPRARSPRRSAGTFPGAANHEEALRGLFAGYVEAKQRQQRARLRRPPALFRADDAGAGTRRRDRGRFDHLLVDEYQDTNRLQAEIVLALRPRGRGLTVVGDDAQSIYSFRAATMRNILDFPHSFDPPAQNHHARSQLSLDTADPRRVQRRDRAQSPSASPRTFGPIAPAAPVRTLVIVGEEARSGALCRDARAGKPRSGREPQIAGGAVSRRPSQRRARTGADAAQHSLRQIGGLKFLDAAHVKDVLAICASRKTRATGSPAFASRRLLPGIGPAERGKIVDATSDGDGFQRSRLSRRPRKARDDFAASWRCCRVGVAQAPWPVDLARSRRMAAPARSSGAIDDCGRAPRRSRRAGADRRDLRLARTFSRRS